MSKRELVCKCTEKKINELYLMKDTASGKSQLANLRKGIGKTPGELPEIWGIFLNGLSEDLYGKYGEPSRGEWAVYLSLTLYAFHQQGNQQNAHNEKISLGKAASQLMNERTDEERKRILRRFAPVVTAKNMSELSHHLRGMVQLLKSKDIGLNYIQLAEDIYDFQFTDSRKNVQLRWGQDFYSDNKGEE